MTFWVSKFQALLYIFSPTFELNDTHFIDSRHIN